MGLDWQRFAPAGTRKQMIATALAGLVLGLGGVTAGTSLVHASERGGLFDFFDELFHGPSRKVEAPVVRLHAPNRARVRYSSLPDARRVTATRFARQTPRPVAALPAPRRRASRASRSAVAAAALTASALGARTVCVRACDGYLFPLGRLGSRADLPVHEAACAAACPNAPTRLFTLGASETDLDRAVGLDGQPYRNLGVANLYRTKRVDQCSCQPEGTVAAPLPLERDLTLRAGDVVATATSARVVTPTRTGGFTVVDFRQARGLTRRARREIDAKIDVVRREADARAFRKAMRAADRGPRIRVAGAGGFEALAAPIEVEPSFATVRVVVASPFVY
ncbi:DUF2865 domain-containing protein [Methylobacterium sp. BTF04]|uniref:DUF2865 domain-containing protein n=1 Tax=Methylobacterium sp. BTF04 TaxID=2708300 RepID=UPI0013CF77B1|nr:DUF2865 domain-containing protein [Methylobacterium sp. BTF04]NEU11515.1 DUF2865 domain-containing protein [Methylobacterium sp. BTF04]